jgi:hypothetical protein
MFIAGSGAPSSRSFMTTRVLCSMCFPAKLSESGMTQLLMRPTAHLVRLAKQATCSA